MKTNCYDCCYPPVVHADACGCCEGVDIVTPMSTYNRPGLSGISYRIGTHSRFLETMTARLTGYYLEKQDAEGNTRKVYPLQGLSTRDKDDPALAMLDAWAMVADVLTFYQERIANEGYLRTATERRSVLEMARLVGYKPRPGVSSSVFLAYTLDENFKEETVIPAGSLSQSIPAPKELPQAFETSEELKARKQWNNLKPRTSRPQSFETLKSNQRLYLKGLNTTLSQNDPLLIGKGTSTPELFWIKDIQPDVDNDRTLILLKAEVVKPVSTMKILDQIQLISTLTLNPSIPPASSRNLTRELNESFGIIKAHKNGATPLSIMKDTFGASEASHSVLKTLVPQLRETLAASLTNANVTADNKIKVYALKVKAAPFGHIAPLRPVGLDDQKVMKYSEWDIKNPIGVSEPIASFTTTITGRTVTFNNTSTGYIDSVLWDFAHASATSGLWNPNYTYEANGKYTVTLTVIGPGGEDTHLENISFAVIP